MTNPGISTDNPAAGSIRPYHLFAHRGHYYVIDIGAMRAVAVTDDDARLLNRFAAAPALSPDAPTRERLARLGLLAAPEARPVRHARGAPVPVVTGEFFLTQSCNLNCIYCYGTGGSYGTGGVMEERTARQAVDWLFRQAGRMKKIHIGFLGGEPLLNFTLLQTVVAYATARAAALDRQAAFSVTTNGTLLDDATVAFLSKHAFDVIVSCDGLRAVQDAQRPFADGRGSYDTVAAGLKKLLVVLPQTAGHAVLAGGAEPQAVKDAMRALGFSRATVTPASASLLDGRNDAAARQRDTERLLMHLEQEAETWWRLIGECDVRGLQELKVVSELQRALLALLHQRRQFHACGAGRQAVAIACNGDVYLCHRFVGREEYKLGSVFGDALDRERYQESPLTLVAACAACPARHYCAGGCKHDNAGASGSVFIPAADFCRLRRRELELAAVIAGDLDADARAFLADHDLVPPKPCLLDF
jgi:uncharacterized protein